MYSEKLIQIERQLIYQINYTTNIHPQKKFQILNFVQIKYF